MASTLNVDVSKRAESSLSDALSEMDTDTNKPTQVPLADAIEGKTIFDIDTGRTKSRILIITTDSSVLEPGSKSIDRFSESVEMFDEVHILVLRAGRVPQHGALRIKDNLWIYVAAATHWWWTPVTALSVIQNELFFANGFRPDLVVAEDPYENGILAYLLRRFYKRPIQIHVKENIYSPLFKAAKKGNWLRYHIAQFVLARMKSARTTTVRLRDELEARFPNLIDLAVLPQYHDYEAIANADPKFSIEEKYPQYTFHMVYLGNLSHQSTFPKLINNIKDLLHNPRVGLIVLGQGSAKSEFEQMVKKLNISRQVVFTTQLEDRISYLKTASLVFVTDISADGDDLVLDAAASGAPLIISTNELRDDVFVDGVSAMLCEPGDIGCIREKFYMVLEDFDLRKRLGERALQAVTTRVHEDVTLYRRAVRDSIESVFSVEDI